MKKYLLLTAAAVSMISCKEQPKEEPTPAVNDDQVEEVAYMSYGATITAKDAMSAEELGEAYATMRAGDTLTVKVKGVIADVCEKKGCWVKLPVDQEEMAFVKFKDYAFFLPRNGKDKEVVLSGKAYKSITPVDELKHYAMDAGESEEEIAKITEDRVTLAFMADGALVEEFENPDVEGQETETAEEEAPAAAE